MSAKYDYNVNIIMCPGNPNVSCMRGADYTRFLSRFKPGLTVPIFARKSKDVDIVTSIEDGKLTIDNAVDIGRAIINDIRRHSRTEYILILNTTVESKYNFNDSPILELKVAILEKTFIENDKQKRVVEDLLYLYPINIIEESKGFRDVDDFTTGPVDINELNKIFLFSI